MGGGDVMTDVFPRAHDARGSENDEVRRGERRATRSRWRWGKRVTTTFASGEGRERRANARKTRENEEGGTLARCARDGEAARPARGRDVDFE